MKVRAESDGDDGGGGIASDDGDGYGGEDGPRPPYSWMSQISARKGGSRLFWTLRLKQTSEFMFPRERSSVRMDNNFAK